MIRTSTLAWRLGMMVVAIVGGVLLLFSTLTFMRLNNGAKAQDMAVSQLVRERFSEQLRLQTQLISNDLDRMFAETRQLVAGIASREDVAAAVASGNIVAIDRVLHSAQTNSPLDGLLVTDAGFHALGSHKPGLVLVRANQVLSDGPQYAPGKQLLGQTPDDDPEPVASFIVMEQDQATSLGLNPTPASRVAVVSMHVVQDAFGDTIGVLVGHRRVRSSGPEFRKFIESERLGVRLVKDDNTVFEAGNFSGEDRASQEAVLLEMGTTDEGTHLFKCSGFRDSWRLCVYEPIENLSNLTQEFVRFIESESLSLMYWLAGMSALSLVGAMIISFTASRRVIAPLHQIKEAVRSVARGNWLAHVAGQRRKDEVGDIARAVGILQRSMKERERLKADLADIEQVRAEKQAMEQSAAACQSELRLKLLELSDLAEQIDLGSRKLSSNAGLAEGEADEVRLIVIRALESASGRNISEEFDQTRNDSVESIDRLGETISTLTADAGAIEESVGRANRELAELERVVKTFAQTLSEVGSIPETA